MVGGRLRVIKDNPAFEAPREKLRSYFSRGELFVASDVHLAFVCGAAGETLYDGTPSLRAAFIAHVAASGDERIVCVRAEEAATELLRQREERRSNLSEFEKLIAETVDSIVLFPESPGSFAELGYFSAFEDLCRKIIIGVREEFQDNSFISLGPIHYASAVSDFRPIPIALGSEPQDGLVRIKERLVGPPDGRRPYRNRFETKGWKEYTKREQLAILDEIVDITGAITEVDLRFVVQQGFGAYDISSLRMLLSLLSATGRITRNVNGDIFSMRRDKRLIECDSDDRVTLKARWTAAYEEHLPEALEELEAART